MIDPISIAPTPIAKSTLTVVPGIVRHRELVDRKMNYLLLKRLFDISFSILFMIAVLSWLLPVVCLLIWLSSRGPVFFLQKRIGRGGKSFTCYKLRTMVQNDEADLLQATEYDERITRLGWFLRKSNMDEFPQFWNVLKGDMSIIGPRPHMYTDCRTFSEMIPGYKFRTLVKPGLTGLAQVKGYHGPSASMEAIENRFYWDRYYIYHLGVWQDSRIIARTILQKCFAMFRYFSVLLPSKPRQQPEPDHSF
ncbi:MAG: sugar transferase [Bacteroidota bacterium]